MLTQSPAHLKRGRRYSATLMSQANMFISCLCRLRQKHTPTMTQNTVSVVRAIVFHLSGGEERVSAFPEGSHYAVWRNTIARHILQLTTGTQTNNAARSAQVREAVTSEQRLRWSRLQTSPKQNFLGQRRPSELLLWRDGRQCRLYLTHNMYCIYPSVINKK